MKRILMSVALLVAVSCWMTPALADWAVKQQGFMRAVDTTTVANLPNSGGASSDVGLYVRQICVGATEDATGGNPWTVTLKRDDEVFKNLELNAGSYYCWDYNEPKGRFMIDLIVSVLDDPSSTGVVFVEVEHTYNDKTTGQ